jgi:hypothetical protein
MNQFKGGLELNDNEDYVVLEGLQKLNVFLSNQVAVVKELLEDAEVFELSIRPKRFALHIIPSSKPTKHGSV